MNGSLPARIALIAAVASACSAPQQRIHDAEIAALAPLRGGYGGVVAGFDIRPETTLVVSLDLQRYIEADDVTIAAMKRDALARWRAAWASAHPHAHATLTVRFIDFIGRPVAQERTRV